MQAAERIFVLSVARLAGRLDRNVRILGERQGVGYGVGWYIPRTNAYTSASACAEALKNWLIPGGVFARIIVQQRLGSLSPRQSGSAGACWRPVSIFQLRTGSARRGRSRWRRRYRCIPKRPSAGRPTRISRRRTAAYRGALQERSASDPPPCAARSASRAACDGARCGWFWATGSPAAWVLPINRISTISG